ncbi:glycosyl transferase family protein [Qipengyuania sp. MTN3-11]|uniref:glycosyl transferase family protein n=1 Tax=Qipengyuania sp. MTN3-11 TaxID=3056557 RepID=UPI0036F3DB73
MDLGGFTAVDWFVLVQHELFLFAAAFFLIGAVDEIAIDAIYLWLRITGRVGREERLGPCIEGAALAGPTAIFIPAWRESRVIGVTIRHALAAWPQAELRLYVGCYRNDHETPAAALVGADGDSRVRIIRHDRDGPTCKADCLNQLYQALERDEQLEGWWARMVVLHDAEDMVDPAALKLMERALEGAAFVQLPVMALPRPGSRWIGGHYTDEFAEVHGKTMVVRDALGAGVPGAGVGCAIERDVLHRLSVRNHGEPFAAGSLTEDYELGLDIAALGGRTRFVRAHAADGRLVATRAYFPSNVHDAVRQKTRWVHGVALQSWDRLGWRGGFRDVWMQMRDRRGPLAAMLLGLAYVLVILSGAQIALAAIGIVPSIRLSPLLETVLFLNLAALAWRALMRSCFTARDFGWREGLFAIPRTLVSNVIAIIAGRRAIAAYLRTLMGEPVRWEKTEHRDHPALAEAPAATS